MLLKYEKPQSEFVEFDAVDVLTLSIPIGDDEPSTGDSDLNNDDNFDINSGKI